jgi:tetratricopeptide (TPR) repeat protein
MKQRAILIGGFLWWCLAAADGGAGQHHKIGRVGCPHCVNDGSEVSQLLQQFDALYAAFKPKEAHKAVMRVLELEPNNTEALSKASRVYIELGDIIPENETGWQEKRLKQYRIAEDYARKAVQADPNNTWGHFYVAASLGKTAAHSSVSKQIDLADEIRSAVEKAIASDPQNGFAYHVYGVWHRKMAEIGKASRFLASTFLRRSVPKGSLSTSVEYLHKAISLNPTVVSHHVELGKTYVALGKLDLARASLKSSLAHPIQFSDDAANKKEAEQLLRELKDR